MILSKCLICGRETRSYPSRLRKYCSRECAFKAVGEKTRRHGLSRTRLHTIWCHMKTRCKCKTSIAYRYYGGRGVKVCEEWIECFESFRDWAIKNGYSDTLEIDRIDTNGDYCPSNCRWATKSQQMQNRRKSVTGKTSRFKGVSWCANVSKWRTQIQFNKSPCHVGLFENEVDAAKAYDERATELFGEFSHLNFPRKEGASS